MPSNPTTLARFWSKVEVGPDGPLGPCFVWSAGLNDKGYGKFRYEGRHLGAHRVAYEWECGPVPDGLQLDHLCRNRCCVRVDHLEPVTCAENLRRSPLWKGNRTHCPKGHEYTPENTALRIRPSGYSKRECVACSRARTHRRPIATP